MAKLRNELDKMRPVYRTLMQIRGYNTNEFTKGLDEFLGIKNSNNDEKNYQVMFANRRFFELFDALDY